MRGLSNATSAAHAFHEQRTRRAGHDTLHAHDVIGKGQQPALEVLGPGGIRDLEAEDLVIAMPSVRGRAIG